MTKKNQHLPSTLIFSISFILVLLLLFLGRYFLKRPAETESSNQTKEKTEHRSTIEDSLQAEHSETKVTEIKITESMTATEHKMVTKEILDTLVHEIIEPAIPTFNGKVQIAFNELDADYHYVYANQNDYIYPASLPKLFLMTFLFDLREQGLMTFDQNIMDLIENMIIYSDNDSFNALLYEVVEVFPEQNPYDMLDEFCRKYGFNETILHNYYQLDSDYGSVLHNYLTDFVFQTTVTDLNDCYQLLYEGQMASKSASKEMLNILSRQDNIYKIPALLPEEAVTYNKTGELDEFTHDSALIESPNANYVLSIMTEAEYDSYANELAMQDLSLKIYQFLNWEN